MTWIELWHTLRLSAFLILCEVGTSIVFPYENVIDQTRIMHFFLPTTLNLLKWPWVQILTHCQVINNLSLKYKELSMFLHKKDRTRLQTYRRTRWFLFYLHGDINILLRWNMCLPFYTLYRMCLAIRLFEEFLIYYGGG